MLITNWKKVPIPPLRFQFFFTCKVLLPWIICIKFNFIDEISSKGITDIKTAFLLLLFSLFGVSCYFLVAYRGEIGWLMWRKIRVYPIYTNFSALVPINIHFKIHAIYNFKIHARYGVSSNIKLLREWVVIKAIT